MHPASYQTMEQELRKITKKKARVLDVGSRDVNGTYRPIVEDIMGWTYIGIDIEDGPNVDKIVDPYEFNFHDSTFDVVISGSTMEHVRAPWIWIKELVRVLKPGGTLIIYTHHTFPYHEYPVDCWRVFPTGMEALFDYTGVLKNYDIRMVNSQDIVGVAVKI